MEIVPQKIWIGSPKVEYSINWIKARQHSRYLAQFQDDANLPTHLFAELDTTTTNLKNFREVWAIINGVGWGVPYDRYWIQLLQVDFYVLVRGFRVNDDGVGSPNSSSYNHVFKNPSPERMLLLERWWKLNQDGIMYSRDDPEDEQVNDSDYEDLEMLLRETPTTDNLNVYPSFVWKINFLRTNW